MDSGDSSSIPSERSYTKPYDPQEVDQLHRTWRMHRATAKPPVESMHCNLLSKKKQLTKKYFKEEDNIITA